MSTELEDQEKLQEIIRSQGGILGNGLSWVVRTMGESMHFHGKFEQWPALKRVAVHLEECAAKMDAEDLDTQGAFFAEPDEGGNE